MTTTPLGERQQIDIRAVERALTSLWKEATESSDDERPAVTRACVLTLIAVVPGRRATDDVMAIVNRLMTRYPNRSIIINAAPEAPDELLDAWAQVYCQMPGTAQSQVCCEQIMIEARGAATERVHGTVLPLLVPDVPAILWWPRGQPFDSALFTRLSALVDRVIVDSATFDEPEQGLVRLAALLDGKLSMSDLAWARLTPWRELTAQFFDAPSSAAHLPKIERVTVEFGARPGAAPDRTPSLLLVGWLAARLGWSLPEHSADARDNGLFQAHRRDGAMIAIELRPAPPRDDLLDHVASLTLATSQATFRVSRSQLPNCAVARAEVQGRETLQHLVRLERLEETDLVAEELRLLSRDHGYEGALRIAAGLATR